MNAQKAQALKAEAERKIAKVLMQLEADTGMIVEGIDLVDLDRTTVSDEQKTLLRSINLTLHRLPATQWNT